MRGVAKKSSRRARDRVNLFGKRGVLHQEAAVTVEERLERIEAMLAVLVQREQVKDHYEIEEFARLVGKAPFTCREWARLGRIRADKKLSGRGAYPRWVVPHAELLRYRKEGLLSRTPP